MNFQSQLQQQLGAIAQGDFDDSSNRPDAQLKQPKIYFNGSRSNVLVRILPPTTPDKNFAEALRTIFLETRTEGGKEIRATFQLPIVPDVNSRFEQALGQWTAEGRVPNKYSRHDKPTRPATRFLVNVVQVQIDPASQKFYYNVDSAGNLVVELLELPQTAFEKIATKLQEPVFAPPQPPHATSEQTQYSFISETNAYAVSITKPPKNSGSFSYDVDLVQSVQLGELPGNWREFAEDLAYQATPTEVHSPDFITKFIDWVNAGSTYGGSAPSFGSAPNFGGAPVQQGFQQPQQGFQQPAQGFQQPQAGFQQPAQGFQQPPVQPGFQQSTQGFQQPATGFQQPQQGFQQPVAPAQPNFAPQAQQGFQQPATQPNFGASQPAYPAQQAVADVAPAHPHPAETPAPQQQQQPAPMQPTEAPVTQTSVQAPVQPVSPAPTQTPPAPSATPSVEQLLAEMQKNA